MKDLSSSIEEFLEENSDAEFDDIIDKFGDPKEFKAANFVQNKRYRTRKSLNIIKFLCIIIVCIALLASIYYGLAYCRGKDIAQKSQMVKIIK